MAEKTKTRLNHVEFTENTDMVVAPPSPIARHVKWKMARTKRYGQMTSIAAQEIFDKIVGSIYDTFLNFNNPSSNHTYEFFCVIVTG